jgi:hypothetical protein
MNTWHDTTPPTNVTVEVWYASAIHRATWDGKRWIGETTQIPYATHWKEIPNATARDDDKRA